MTAIDQLSFLPDDYKHRRTRRRTMVVGTAAALVVLAAMGSNVFVAQRSLKRVESAHAAATLAYDDATRRIDGLRHQRQEQRDLIGRALLAASLTDGVPRSNILAELTNALPAGALLLELNVESRPRPETASAGNSAFDMKKAALEARRRTETAGTADIPAQDAVVKICGLADTDVQVAQYLQQLSHCPLFQDVKLLISETTPLPGSATSTLRRFQIQTMVKPNARPQPGPGLNPTATAAVTP